MTETPVAHSSLVGGSSAARRLNCLASYKLEQKAPRSGGSKYAREGTALHEMLALILDKDMQADAMLPFVYKQEPKVDEAGTVTEEAWEHTIDHDTWERLGVPALDMFDDFLNWLEADQDGAPATYMIEESAEFPGIPGAFGTSDVPFRCGEVGGIWDWKMGRTPVAAEDNAQLLFYFAACRQKYPDFFDGVKRVVLCISQPQRDDQEPDTWETTLEDVDDFILDLQDAVKANVEGDHPPEKGSWCKFADCKAVCPLHINAGAKLGGMLASLDAHKRDQESPTPTEGPMDFDAFLSEAMELAELAEDWAKHIAGITQERLERGGSVAGWKVVAKASSGREWTVDEPKVVSRLRSRGLKADQYYTKKVVTPPAAEKLLKKMGTELPEDIVRKKPSSGYTLTREGDPRRDGSPAAKASRLRDKLLAITKGKENGK